MIASEKVRKTIVEYAPDSEFAKLARLIAAEALALNPPRSGRPTP